jgi:RHS repeat-associated protein
VFYYFSDHLKTASVITDSAGVIKAESDYYPWGGELQFVNNDSNDYKFTGKKRDIETGLDYFGARYYSNGLGRWVSADWSAAPIPVPYANFGDPQSLNLYGFVGGNPASKADPDGHCPWCPTPDQTAILAWFGFKQSHPEGAFAAKHPFIGHEIGSVQHGSTNLSTNATRFSTGLGLGENSSREGSQVNAVRHTIWQASIASKYGAGIAKQAGDAHESNPKVDLSVRSFSGNGALSKADQSIDLLNNQIG